MVCMRMCCRMRFYPHIFQASGKQEMKPFSSTNTDNGDFDKADDFGDFGDEDSETNSGYQPPEMIS